MGVLEVEISSGEPRFDDLEFLLKRFTLDVVSAGPAGRGNPDLQAIVDEIYSLPTVAARRARLRALLRAHSRRHSTTFQIVVDRLLRATGWSFRWAKWIRRVLWAWDRLIDLVPLRRGRDATPPMALGAALAPTSPGDQEEALVRRALEVTSELHAAVEIASSSYRVLEVPFDKMNGSLNWMPLWERYCETSVLRVGRRPLTLGASFAGRATHVGFSFGCNLQVMCATARDHHRLIVHVGDEGDFALLRDGKRVEPVHLAGRIHRAIRLPEELSPRLAALGIDRSLMTQEVLVWSGEVDRVEAPACPIDLSVVVVCTKYSRRFNQLVSSIARQQDFDVARCELIVAHVPGLDGTEDVLEGAGLLWPRLRIVRMRFPPSQATAKGFMINQSVGAASGRRIIVTDADVIFPPDIFRRLETEFREDHFVAVAGRKMLDRLTTARLLAGLDDPVADFERLRDRTPGELRIGEAKGTPIGYFQCVLKSHFEVVRYEELPHFEAADMRFSLDVRRTFGRERVIGDAVLLHQDHSGSRWFGTERQF